MILPRTNNCKFIYDMPPRMQSQKRFVYHPTVKSYRTNNSELFYYSTIGPYRMWWTSRRRTLNNKDIWF